MAHLVSCPQEAPNSLIGVEQVSQETIDQQKFELDFATFRNECSNEPFQKRQAWSEVKKLLTTFQFRSNKLGSPAWSPTLYPEKKTRLKENVIHVSCAVIDVDDGTPFDVLESHIQGYTYLIHTSFRHSPDLPKYRVVMPLAVPIPAAHWEVVWHRINNLVGNINDPATKDASRIYFLPVCPPGNETITKIVEGRLLDGNTLPDPPDLPKLLAKQDTKKKSAESKVGQAECTNKTESDADLSPREGLQEMVARCTFMKWASVDDNQPDVPEPLWMAMISNACRFEGGEEWIHEASSAHPEYDEAATDRKISHVESWPSPITCKRIQELGFDGCPEGGCPLRSGGATKAPAGLVSWIYKVSTARPPSPATTQASATREQAPVGNIVAMRTPVVVRAFVESYYPDGLVYINNTFYGYADGYYQRLQLGPDLNRKVVMYLSDIASEEDLQKISRKKVDGLVGLLQCYYASKDDMAAPNKGLICLANGTLDTSIYSLLPHSPEHCLMTKTDIEWNPEAGCPRWLQFIDEIFANDIDKQQKNNFIQEWFGYCLIPDAGQHKFVWMVGSGGNGKSILLLILRKIVGEANVSDAAIERLDRGAVRAELEGKLINISSEISAGATIADGYLKSIVGGEPVEAERKYLPSFTFRPYVRLIGATNNLPRLLDHTDGFSRRAVILTFNRQFRGDECDPRLEDKLLGELPGILVWAVEGLRRLRSRGRFEIPQSSNAALVEYRKESDPVALFVDECLEKSDSVRMQPGDIFAGFNAWAKANNHKPLSSINFGRRLGALGFKECRPGGKKFWMAAMKVGSPIYMQSTIMLPQQALQTMAGKDLASRYAI